MQTTENRTHTETLSPKQTKVYAEFLRFLSRTFNKLAVSSDVQGKGYSTYVDANLTVERNVDTVDAREFLIGAAGNILFFQIGRQLEAIQEGRLQGAELEAAAVALMRLLLTISIGTSTASDTDIAIMIGAVTHQFQELVQTKSIANMTLEDAKKMILTPAITRIQEQHKK
jgi:hypothetical protein